MAVYLKKRETRHRDIIDSYYVRLNEAEKNRDKEVDAAIRIQKWQRMFWQKWKL
jgi:hypothetical protein